MPLGKCFQKYGVSLEIITDLDYARQEPPEFLLLGEYCYRQKSTDTKEICNVWVRRLVSGKKKKIRNDDFRC